MILTLLAAAAFVAQPAPDDPGPLRGDWTELARYEGLILEHDESATRRDGDRVRVRMRAGMPRAPGGVRWGIALFEFTCGSWTARPIALTEYGADGAFLRRVPDADAAASFAQAPSPDMRQFMEAACHRTGWGEEGAE
jgi:hypothetical protein